MSMRPDAISAEEWETLRRSLGWSLPQTEIMRRLFAGKSYEEIAREMATRRRTVRTAVNRLYRQFGVSDRAQLVLHVLTVLREHWEAGKNIPSREKGRPVTDTEVTTEGAGLPVSGCPNSRPLRVRPGGILGP